MRFTGLRLGHGGGESVLAFVAVVGFGLAWAAAEHLWQPGSAYDGDAVDVLEEALPSASLWLVDGYNVLHVGLLGGEERRDWWRASSRQRVIERAQAFREAQPGEIEVWVAFDGSRPADGDGVVCPGVHTVFSESADEWLVREVKKAEDPGWLAVVTADRRVRDRVRHRGAHVVSPRAFLAGCVGCIGGPPSPSSG